MTPLLPKSARRPFLLLAAAALCALCAGRPANAQNTQLVFTSGTDLTVATDWNSGAGPVPAVGNDAVFSASSPSGTLSLSAATATYGSLDVTDSGTTTAITNVSTTGTTTLTLGGAGDNGDSVAGSAPSDLIYLTTGATVLNLAGTTKPFNIVLGQSGSFDVGNTSTLNIGVSGGASTLNLGGDTVTISGAGAVNIGSVISNGTMLINAGTTTLTGANTFSGGITLAGGTLYMNSASALGAGPLTIDAGTTIADSSGTITDSQNNSLVWNGSFTVAGAQKYTFGAGSAVSIATPLTLTDSGGTFTVNGAITSTDGLGIFDITKAGSSAVSFGENVSYSNAETFHITGGTEVLSGTVSGSAPLTITGGGALEFSGTNNTTGSSAMTVLGSTLNFTDSGGMTSAARASSVTLQLSTLSVNGDAAANSVDAITGALTISGSGGYFDPVVITANTAKNAELTAGSLGRAGNGIAVFTGASLGVDAPGSTADTTNILFTTAPTLIGGGGGAGSTNISIIPWAIGGNSGSTGSTFVTYTANGIRPLNTATEYATSITDGSVSTNNVDLAAGTVTINQGATINSLLTAVTTISGTGTLTVTSGAILMDPSNASGTPTISCNLNFGSAEGVIGGPYNHNGLSITGTISGSGGLTLYQDSTGANVYASLSNYGNTYTGNTTILSNFTLGSSAGVLPSGNRTGDIYLGGAADWVLNSGGGGTTTINGLNGSGTISYNHSSVAGLTFGDNDANGNFSGVISIPINGAVSLTKIGTGAETFSGANTFTTGGQSTTVSLNGGTLSLNFAAAGAPATNILNNNNAANVTTAFGGGTLSLTGSASTTNSQSLTSTTINAGASAIVLNANATANPLLVSAGGITRNTGGTLDVTLPTGTQGTANGVVTTSTANIANGIVVSATSGGIAYATVNGGSDWAALSGSNIVAYSSVGSYSTGNANYLSANNVSVTNGDTMTSGTVNSLYFNAATDGLTLSGTDVIGAGGVLVTPTATSASITSGTLISGAGKELVLIDNGALTVNSVIGNSAAGASALTISGAGVTTLGGSNSYTGQTYLNGAAIISNNANLGAVATGAQINMNGGTLETSGSFSLDAAGSDKRPIVLGNNGGTFNVGAGGDLTVSGVISGGIVGVTTALTKTGAGALTLTAANTYAGNTYIKAGSLFVSGSLSGSAEVIVGDSANLSTAAILSGTGTVGSVILGAAASNTGAEVEPSGGVTESSAGATLHTGNFTVGAGSGATLALQIGRTTAGGSLSGDSSDHISVNGSVSLDGNLQLTLQSSYTPQVNDILYLIIHGSGTSTTGDFATVNGVALSGNTFTFDNLTWQLTETASASGNSFTGGDDVAIEAVAAIPEPSTWASILAGFGILVLLQNNRRRRI